MRIPAALRANTVAYFTLAFLFCFVTIYQLRASLDTVHLQRSLDFYIPFLVTPLTDRVDSRGYSSNWEQGRQFENNAVHPIVLRLGDRILRVNGLEFKGMSIYLRELWNAQHQPP